MSPGISFDLHGWRGIGTDQEPDLFRWRRRFGFLTVTIRQVEWVARVRELEAEVAKLRDTIARAIRKSEEGR